MRCRRCRSPRPQRRIARGAQRVAERREHDDAQDRNRERGHAERQPVEMRRALPPRRRPHPEDAVVAAGHLHPLERDRPDDLREGERQHREVDAGQLHREAAEHRSPEAAEQRPDQQARDHRQPRHLGQQGDAIGPDAEVGGMAERYEPADRHEEMQAGGEEHEHGDFAPRRSAHNCRDERQRAASASPAIAASRSNERQRTPGCTERPGVRRAAPPRPCRAAPRAARPARPPSPGTPG